MSITHGEGLDVDRIIAQLTLEEKASLLSGANFWETKRIERDGVLVPSIFLADGPHGLRTHAREGAAAADKPLPATCFPTAAALGSTWDVALLERVGAAIGREARAHGVSVVLGPGANIKRDPRCGRNFEYLAEDPVLSGELAAALIRGTQGEGVGASLKHLAANNQETDRMRVSAEIDERALREIYLASFERAIRRGDPWTVMSSYNRVNGVYASQNRWLLTDVLRRDWGWSGLVMSDWGAVHDRTAAADAGLDLEMPGGDARAGGELVDSVVAGGLDRIAVDTAARNVVALVARAETAGLTHPKQEVDFDAHHELAREAAAAGSVLLRNEPVEGCRLLPLENATGLVVIGEFARTPRYQGAGSSSVNPMKLDDALSAVREATGLDVPFAPGFTLADGATADEQHMLTEAVALARSARTVLLFLGLPAEAESEGYDRTGISLPPVQLRLLEAVHSINPRVVVVLAGGGVVTVTEWQHNAPAILHTWLGGQAGGSAVIDLLLGVRTPSGKLAETIPARLHDVPAFGNFPGELGTVRYGESLAIGYRWYDMRREAVGYPFGFGLSYTTFDIGEVRASVHGSGKETQICVEVCVTNTGDVAGAEVVQLYVGDPEAIVQRPDRELKAFAKVYLEPGASEVVSVDLTARDLAFWHPILERWTVEGGTFVIWAGSSSRDLSSSVTLEVVGEDITLPLGELATVDDVLTHPVGRHVFAPAFSQASTTFVEMMRHSPLTGLIDFGLLPISRDDFDELRRQTNAESASAFGGTH